MKYLHGSYIHVFVGEDPLCWCMSVPKRLTGSVSLEEARSLYEWADSFRLSRPRKNVARDFADGVLVAEIISQSQPDIVELHDFASASSFPQKMLNWNTLNMKVFRKLGFGLHPKDMEDCANMAPGSIEKVLQRIRRAISNKPQSNSVCELSRISSATEVRTAPSTRSMGYDTLEELRNQLDGQVSRISELERTVEVLKLKNIKLEELLEIKDKKIEALRKHGTL